MRSSDSLTKLEELITQSVALHGSEISTFTQMAMRAYKRNTQRSRSLLKLQQLIMQSVAAHGTEISIFMAMAMRAYRQNLNFTILPPPRTITPIPHPTSVLHTSQPHTYQDSQDTKLPALSPSETTDHLPSFQTLRKQAGHTNLAASRQLRSLAEIPRQYAQLTYVLTHCRNIVIVAGAGISTGAGIPDFRSKHGLFVQHRKDHGFLRSNENLFHIDVYNDNEHTVAFQNMIRGLAELAASAPPTECHRMIAFLAETGRLLRLYTQNIDELETCFQALRTETPLPPRAPWPPTIQLHGGLSLMTCTKCFTRFPLRPAIFSGADTPPCTECLATNSCRRSEDYCNQRSRVLRPPAIGRLRPRITLYGEETGDGLEIVSVLEHDAKKIDALIVIGTSMRIPAVLTLVTLLARALRVKGHSDIFWINPIGPRAVKAFPDFWTHQILKKSDEVAKALFKEALKE